MEKLLRGSVNCFMHDLINAVIVGGRYPCHLHQLAWTSLWIPDTAAMSGYRSEDIPTSAIMIL
eukprot:4140167-Amphidinium_carterae.1